MRVCKESVVTPTHPPLFYLFFGFGIILFNVKAKERKYLLTTDTDERTSVMKVG